MQSRTVTQFSSVNTSLKVLNIYLIIFSGMLTSKKEIIHFTWNFRGAGIEADVAGDQTDISLGQQRCFWVLFNSQNNGSLTKSVSDKSVN